MIALLRYLVIPLLFFKRLGYQTFNPPQTSICYLILKFLIYKIQHYIAPLMDSIHDYVTTTLVENKSKPLLNLIESEEYDTDAFRDDVADINQSNINRQCPSIFANLVQLSHCHQGICIIFIVCTFNAKWS